MKLSTISVARIILIVLMGIMPLITIASVKIDGIYYNLDTENKTAEVTYHPWKYEGNIILPKSVIHDGFEYIVTSIGYYAFYECSGLSNISIPKTVSSIGDHAFDNCSGLSNISIPNTIKSIGRMSFFGCSGMTSVDFPSSVVYIGDGAFYACHGLTSITIPNGVAEIGENPFQDCPNITNITVASDNPFFDSRNNCNAIIESKTNVLVSGCKNTVIPNTVTSIGPSAFSDCSNLTNINIPNSVTNIGDDAFWSCI